jgi:2-isopropylmalate synthase
MTRPCATVRRVKASISRSRTNSASPRSSILSGFITLKAAGRAAIPRTSNFSRRRKRKIQKCAARAFGSTRKKGTPVEQDDQVRLLIEAETPVVTIYGKTSMLHVKEVLRCTPEENLAMIGDTVRFLKDHGKFVIYDAEHAFDGYKLDADYALATWQAAEKAGADFVVLCDTNGGCLPDEIAAITKVALGKLNCKVGIHTHDDIGLGVANALAALEAGAVHVQGTINGYGERTGNCNLTSVIPCVALKLKKLPVSRRNRWRSSRSFRRSWTKSRTCATIRACRGSAHRRSRTRAARTSTPCKSSRRATSTLIPSLVGNERNVLISDLAGRSNIVIKAQELGFKLTNDTPELKPDLESRQGIGKSGLRIRGRRRFAGVAHRQIARIANRRSAWTRITSPCVATQKNPFARRRSKSVLSAC